MTAPQTIIDFRSRRAHDSERREANKLARRLRRLTGQAILDYHMIGEGDVVMVCLSGGKDSYGLLDILLFLQSRAPVSFDLVAVNIDQGHPGFPQEVLPNYLRARAVPFHIEHQDTHRIVTRVIKEGQTMCSLCSRLRRGILYRLADELGATRIALGHHREDILETFFLNMFHGGILKAMPPKLLSDDGRHVVIRPLSYCAEEDLAQWAEVQQFPIIPCNLCGSQEKSERRALKAMMKEWGVRYPGRIEAMFRSLSHVTPSHLLDGALWDFAALGKKAD